MTYKEYKKAVASRRGISLYLLEKGLKAGAFHLRMSAALWRCHQRNMDLYTQEENAECIENHIEDDAANLEYFRSDIIRYERGKFRYYGCRRELSQSELVSKLKPME